MKTEDRKEWQTDPMQVKTERVQVWSENGTMETGQCMRFRARQMVTDGKAFVISDQAIGRCDL